MLRHIRDNTGGQKSYWYILQMKKKLGKKSKSMPIKGRVVINNQSFIISYICEGKLDDPCYGKD